MSSTDLVIVGRIRKVHGLKGELVVESLTDDPGSVFVAGGRVHVGTVRGVVKDPPVEITSVRPFKEGWIVKFVGVDDRNTADLWRERYLLMPQNELTPLADHEVYVHELLGMQVVRASGEAVGQVKEVYELPQGLTLEVSRGKDSSVLIPYDRVVTLVDRAARQLTIDPPDGLLD